MEGVEPAVAQCMPCYCYGTVLGVTPERAGRQARAGGPAGAKVAGRQRAPWGCSLKSHFRTLHPTSPGEGFWCWVAGDMGKGD